MITKEEIHNIYLHMSGKAEGIAEATGSADFPVLFANAILEYAKRPWVGLTEEEIKIAWAQLWYDLNHGKFSAPENEVRNNVVMFGQALEAMLKERNT